LIFSQVLIELITQKPLQKHIFKSCIPGFVFAL